MLCKWLIRHGWGWPSCLVIQSMPSLWHFGKNILWPRVENEAVVVGSMSNFPSPPIKCFDQPTPEMYIHTTCNEACKCSSTLCFVFMKPQIGWQASSYRLVHFLPHPSRMHTNTHYSPSPWGWWVANYTSRVLTLLCLPSSHFPKRRIFGRYKSESISNCFCAPVHKKHYLGNYMLAKLTMNVVRFDVPSFKGSRKRECQYLSGVHTTVCLVSVLTVSITLSLVM